MNAKQDRQGVRTAAELERKYQFKKQFQTFEGYASDNRDNIVKQGTQMQTELQELEQRTGDLINDTVSNYTPLGTFNELSWRVADVSEHVTSVEDSLSNYTLKTDFNSLDETVDGLSDELSAVKVNHNTLSNEVAEVKTAVNSHVTFTSGESNGWYYRKWSDGRAECWKTLTHKTAINTAWGTLYSGTATSRQTYPIAFVDKPIETASLTAGSYQAILYPEKDGNGVNGSSASACYNLCRPSAIATSSEYYISLYVLGRWK